LGRTTTTEKKEATTGIKELSKKRNKTVRQKESDSESNLSVIE